MPVHTTSPGIPRSRRCASNGVELGGEAVLFLGFVGDVGGGHAY